MDERSNSPQSELVYVPRPSWQPALLAAGLAGILAGLFVWWPYGAIGALVALAALRSWVKESREEYARLPRSQQLTTGSIPAVPLKHSGD